MAQKKTGQKTQDFRINALVDDSLEIYTDTIDTKQKVGGVAGYGASLSLFTTQEQILNQLSRADNDATRNSIIKASRLVYAINPIYAKIIEYYVTSFFPRYYITPRFLPTTGKKLTGKKWADVYNQMVEICDGLNLDNKLIPMLRKIFVEGGVYFTTLYSEDEMAIDTIILPNEYCQKIGETILGTPVIQFDMSYFKNLGLSDTDLAELLSSFPEEFTEGYRAYLGNNKLRWFPLDPRHSSCVLLNEKGIPTLFYAFIGIVNNETYMQNCLDKNTQAIQTIVEHHIPTWQDKLLLETTEMRLLQKKLSGIVRSVKNSRLVTTIGDVKIHSLAEHSESVADTTLQNAYKSIFDTAGLNNGIFYGDSQYSINASRSIDRGYVWQFIEKLANFYNVALNNFGIDFSGYQLELTMVPLSRDNYSEDLNRFREDAKVGVGILPFMIASGIKQKNVDSHLDMETNLDLVNRIMPLRSANTMASSFEEDEREQQKANNTANEEPKNGRD